MALTIKRKDGVSTKIGSSLSLDIAKKNFNDDLVKGINCPCCGKHAKVYSVSLSQSMVEALNWVAKEGLYNGDLWVDIQRFAPRKVLQSRTYMKLAHWGLLLKRPTGQGNSRAVWRVTDTGLQFLYGDLKVPKLVRVYDRQCVSVGDRLVYVTDVVKKQGIIEDLIQR